MVLTNSAHTQVYQSTLADGGFTFVKSTLEICNTVVSDSGSYNIAAENSFGTQYASFQFIVQTEREYVQCTLDVWVIHTCAVSNVLYIAVYYAYCVVLQFSCALLQCVALCFAILKRPVWAQLVCVTLASLGMEAPVQVRNYSLTNQLQNAFLCIITNVFCLPRHERMLSEH